MELMNFGKPVEKLIEEVSKGIGTLYKPRAIRREAKAEAERIEIIAHAEAKKSLIEYDTEQELIRRTKERLYNQEVSRQINIEKIADKAVDQLPDEVSEKPLGDDWRTRFFTKAQDISEEETQEIWAKILAGELASPGKVSIRTLEVIYNLNKDEAQIFEKACTLSTANSYILKLKNDLKEFDISYSDLLTLRDAGLMHSSDNLVIISGKLAIPSRNLFVQQIGLNLYQLTPTEKYKQNELRLPQFGFTKAGEELCAILNKEINKNYIAQLIKEITEKGFQVSIIPTSESYQ